MLTEFKCAHCSQMIKATLDGKQIENIGKEVRKCPKCGNKNYEVFYQESAE